VKSVGFSLILELLKMLQ